MSSYTAYSFSLEGEFRDGGEGICVSSSCDAWSICRFGKFMDAGFRMGLGIVKVCSFITWWLFVGLGFMGTCRGSSKRIW